MYFSEFRGSANGFPDFSNLTGDDWGQTGQACHGLPHLGDVAAIVKTPGLHLD
jgi:hypothetical protein